MADQTLEDPVKKDLPEDEPADEDDVDAADRADEASTRAAENNDEQAAFKAMLSMASEYFSELDASLLGGAGQQADAPTQFKHPGAAGGNWAKGENGWQFTDASGKVVDKFNGQVKDLAMRDGVLVATMSDGRVVKSHNDGSSLEYTNDKLTKIRYTDGRVRELKWDGNTLTQVTSSKGEWFERQKDAKGEYIDRWKPEKGGQPWNGKITVPDQEKGDYVLESTDDSTNGPVTYMRDGAEKTQARDGSYVVKYPSGASERFNAEGDMIGLTGSDRVNREFGWITVDGKKQLDSVKVTDANNKVANWKQENGKWTWNGEATNYTFNVDSKARTYSFSDPEKDNTTTVTTTAKQVRYGDGTQVNMGPTGDVTSATKGDTTFEYVRDKSNVVEVRETKAGEAGRTWKKNEQGQWTDGSKVLEGGLKITESGEPSFAVGGKTVVYKLDGRSVEQTKNADGSTVESSDGRTKITATDGSTRELFTRKDDNGQEVLYKEITVRDGKRQEWERVSKATDKGTVEYTDEWKNKATGEVEVRKQMSMSSAGELSVEYGDGSKYIARTNGTERRENAAEKWTMELENGKPVKINFADGYERTYKWKGNVVDSMVVTPPGEKPITWTRIGDNKYKTNTGSVTNGTIDVDPKGKYTFSDTDEKTLTTRLPNGKQFIKDTTTGVESENVGGKSIAMRKGDAELKMVRDEKGKVTELQDTKANTKWSKQADGTWQASAIDDQKPWTKPNDERLGDVVVNEKKGTVSFLGSDGSLIRHSLDGVEKVSGGTELEKKIVDDKRLTEEEKIRFLENLDKFSKRKIDDAQKAESLKNIERVLDAKDAKDGYFDAKERAKLAEQLAWHVANPSLDGQGGRPNCTVSDIRIAMQHETPGDWSRMMADMVTQGYFKTKDGSIVHPKDRASFRPSEAEKSFPPADGERSWLGRISDVTMLDIHWQRRTTDSFGNTVNKGEMTYEEVKPTDADDSGGRIFKYYEHNGQWYRSEQKRSPGVFGKDVMDIYRQITGRNEDNRYIINGDQNQKGDGVTSVSSVAELEAALSKGPYPKIIQVQNDVLYKKKHDGKEHCHVVVVTGYENGKALIDNSHHSQWDRLSEGIPVAHLFEATKKRGDARYEAEEDKQARQAVTNNQTRQAVTINNQTVVANNQIRYLQVTNQNNTVVYYNNGYYYNNNGNNGYYYNNGRRR